MVPRYLLFPASLLLLGVAGCASVPTDWGRGDLARLTAERGRAAPQATDAKAFTDRALNGPLTADTAVQLALINNPDLRRQAAQLGFAAAELYDAGRLANPVFSLTRLSGDSSAGANVPQLTMGIAVNFVNLLFLPANTRYARAQFEAAKLEVGGAALDLAAEVEAAWYGAVGADQLAQMREAAAKAQRASADLSKRYFDAGNINARELAMERAAASQAALAAISARANAVEARSALNRLMGLSAEQTHWMLDARLAEPLPHEDEVSALQRQALDSRLDLASLRRKAQAIADRYGITRRTRLINSLEIGVERERDFDGALDVGPTLSLELPLFNWGGGRVTAIQAALDQAEADLDGRVLDVSNDVARFAARVQAMRQLAVEYREALIPERETVVARMQEEHNYMLIGVFEVLAAKQQEYEAYSGYIEAVRDYWMARSELTRAVGRRLPSSEQPAAPTLDPVEVLRPKDGGMDHSGHSKDGMPQDMEGMDHSRQGASEGREAAPHAGHSTKGMGGAKDGMQEMPGMEDMDHSQPGKAAAEPDGSPAGNPMPGMPGMVHGAPAAATSEAVRNACAGAKANPSDLVNQALLLKCREAQAVDPHAGHPAPPPAKPKRASDPESPHVH